MNASEARALTEKKIEDDIPVRRAAVYEAIVNEVKGGISAHAFMPHEVPEVVRAELEKDGYKVTSDGKFVTVSW